MSQKSKRRKQQEAMRPKDDVMPGTHPEQLQQRPSPRSKPPLSEPTPQRPPEVKGGPPQFRDAPRRTAAEMLEAHLKGGSSATVRSALAKILFNLKDSEVDALAESAVAMLKTST